LSALDLPIPPILSVLPIPPFLPSRYNRPVLRPYRGIAPRVHPTAFIDSSAQIIGDVEIGDESSVWMCTVVRGDVNIIRVGTRSSASARFC
jgi:hypothetical protein